MIKGGDLGPGVTFHHIAEKGKAHKLSILLVVCLLIGTMPAEAQTHAGGTGYWFYFTTPATVERPLIGIGEVWPENGRDEGYLYLDAEDQKYRSHSLRFDIEGTNIETGKLDITLWVFLTRKNANDPPAGQKVLKGILTNRVQGSRITWAGTLRVINKKALLSRLDPGALKQAGLSKLPDEFSLEMIGFQHFNVGFGEAGLQHTFAEATWLPERDREAQQWLKDNGIDYEKDVDWEDTHVSQLVLPAFEQNLMVYRMLRSGIFDEVIRSRFGAGPGQAYGVACMQSAVFRHLPESAEGVEEGIIFARKFITELASLPRFQGARFGEPVVVRTHRLRFSIIGPSSSVSKGPQGYWEHFILELSFYREFGQTANAMAIGLSVVKSEITKGPAGVEPPLERFDPNWDDSSPLLTAIGTVLGRRVKATRQGLAYEP